MYITEIFQYFITIKSAFPDVKKKKILRSLKILVQVAILKLIALFP